MSDSSVFNIPPTSLRLGQKLAAGANGTTLYKADLLQGERSFQVVTVGRAMSCFRLALTLYRCPAGGSEEVMH